MSKQIIQSQNQYFEKVIRDKDGRLIRAKFFVYENAGRIKARLVDYVYITAGSISGKVSNLLGFVSKQVSQALSAFNFQLYTFNFELLSLFSIGSKPRAPTF